MRALCFPLQATEVDETAELEQQQEGSEGAGGDDVDAADLDELDALADASASTDLRAYLKQVFESIDANGDGEISAAELKVRRQPSRVEGGSWGVLSQLCTTSVSTRSTPAVHWPPRRRHCHRTVSPPTSLPLSPCLSQVKLDSDNELQVIIESAGGDGNWHVMEQLDENGDGTISWMEVRCFFTRQSPTPHPLPWPRLSCPAAKRQCVRYLSAPVRTFHVVRIYP